jgi:hypothetical protein
MNDVMTLSAEQVEAMDEAQTQQVLAAWVKARRSELPEALGASKSKLHSKLAKKALYQLQSSGVAVQARPVAEAGPAPLTRPPEEFHAALSAIIGTGERAIFFGRPKRGGGFDSYQGILSDELGVLQLNQSFSSRAAYRKHIDTLEHHATLKVLITTFERVKLELSRALTLNERSGQALPQEAGEIVRALALSPADPDWPVPAPLETDEAVARGAGALLEVPELQQWLPSEPALLALAERVSPPGGAPLEAEAAEACAREEAVSYLTAARRKVYSRRLWSMGELLEHSQRAPLGVIACAEARRLFHTSAPSVFFEAMFCRMAAQRLESLKVAAAIPAPAP